MLRYGGTDVRLLLSQVAGMLYFPGPESPTEDGRVALGCMSG
jgi:hypothetical protein